LMVLLLIQTQQKSPLKLNKPTVCSNGKKERYELGKYFGTDGVRGVANQTLTPEIAYKIGRVAGYVFSNEGKRPKVLIGMDTRVSGPMFEGALIAGLLSVGSEVMLLGIISTPGVAYL